MNYLKARKLSNIFAFTGLGLSFLTLLFENSIALVLVIGAVGIIFIGIGLVVTYIYYRCPHCQSMLPFRSWGIPTFCPNCGEKLEK